MTGPEHAITIRPEAAGDEAMIHALTEAAFRDMPFSDGDEHHLVDRLRADGDLTLSLVAEDAERIVGHIAFSPVTISDGAAGWFGLGPVSVWPEFQKQGIGGTLIRRGIADMRAMGARGIVLLGSNEYYPRFGFRHEPQLTYPGPPSEYFQCLLLQGDLPSGEVKYAPAFG
ncbi:GNAT family N-acetyltransferase [Erythrobacter sp. THAF29]|uniref:GNAT family N-acetyltransferase n=1 Tax=Erythrobacter sp. THAF29 TaxID=2587851 RepID=UPI0012684ACC|nr:N-acetyltransferase [Erythrobacter sp. THAF29]QFT76573.1 Acetyltransferase (GNAT) family protein [Erythrobacter sp. THAF29]